MNIHRIHLPLSIGEQLEEIFKEKQPSSFKVVHFALTCFGEKLYQRLTPQSPINPTSCLHSTLAINQIFLNEEESYLIHRLFSKKWTLKNDLKGKPLHCRDLVFPLSFAQAYHDRLEIPSYKNLKKIILKGAAEELKDLKKTIKHPEELKTYNYNEAAFIDFEQRIKRNNFPGSNLSYLYNIVLNFNVEEHQTDPDANHALHAFSIEQINHQSDVYFRLIQSAVDRTTVLEDFTKRGYNPEDPLKGCLKGVEMESYLKDLRRLVCGFASNPKINNDDFIKCFGVDSLKNLSYVYQQINDAEIKISGLAFFYTCHEINDQATLGNLIELIKESSEMQTALKKHYLNKKALC